MSSPRARIYPGHYLVAFIGLGIGSFGFMLLNGFRYVGEADIVGVIGFGALALGLVGVGWVAAKRLPLAIVIGASALVVMGTLGVFAMRYSDAVALEALGMREIAVTNLCAGGAPVPSDAPPPVGFRVRHLYSRSDGELWMDPSGYGAWPEEHVPELVVCIVESNEIVDQQTYVDEQDGTPMIVARERPVVTLRAIRSVDAQVVLETRLTGGEPGPFPYEIGTGIDSHLRGDSVTLAAIDAAIAPALSAR